MSRLRVFDERAPGRPLAEFTAHADIAVHSARVGVRFEQWQAQRRWSRRRDPRKT